MPDMPAPITAIFLGATRPASNGMFLVLRYFSFHQEYAEGARADAKKMLTRQ
jgi:hypothetical protein